MIRSEETLEFNVIKRQVADFALSENARERLLALEPHLDEGQCRRAVQSTTAARTILDACGNPPLATMQEVGKVLALCQADSMLLPEQLEAVARFASSCKRMVAYLRGAESVNDTIAHYGASFADLEELRGEIERCIRGQQVDGDASPALRDIRRKIENAGAQIKEKLASILRSNKSWFSDSFVSQRGGRFVLPVKKEYRNRFSGSVVEVSGTGGTYFMEPSSVVKLQSNLSALQIDEDNEVRRVLYTLTAMVGEEIPAIHRNMEAMEELDFLFAKAKLSAAINARPAELTTERRIRIRRGRHPLLHRDACVPLDFEIGDGVRGVIITGPNTGGKTVAIKTVGLLSMMAQCGLHVPADEGTILCMHAAYLCDIGDGQSISENLSTFSGHMKKVIAVLENAGPESLVLLDELGSGTDPAEGMGIAVAVLEELRQRGCLFLVTTHYPQVKDFAEEADGVISARMAFDRETLSPLYRLELGRSGESCALHIAQRLGLPGHLLKRAYEEAYRSERKEAATDLRFDPDRIAMDSPAQPSAPAAKITKKQEARTVSNHAAKFQMGDSVTVYPERELGIVFQPADSSGQVGVQVKGKKRFVNHKRLTLKVAAAELYPEGYDLSVVLDTVENRKARHQMDKGHRPEFQATYDPVSPGR